MGSGSGALQSLSRPLFPPFPALIPRFPGGAEPPQPQPLFPALVPLEGNRKPGKNLWERAWQRRQGSFRFGFRINDTQKTLQVLPWIPGRFPRVGNQPRGSGCVRHPPKTSPGWWELSLPAAGWEWDEL